MSIARAVALLSSLTLAGAYIWYRAAPDRAPRVIASSKLGHIAPDPRPQADQPPPTQSIRLMPGPKSGHVLDSGDVTYSTPTTQSLFLMSGSKSGAIIQPADLRAPVTRPTTSPATQP